MTKRRVVITGMGAITPIGLSAAESWKNAKAGVCGIGPITLYDTADMKVKLAAEAHGFAPEDFIDKREARKMDRFTQFAMVCLEIFTSFLVNSCSCLYRGTAFVYLPWITADTIDGVAILPFSISFGCSAFTIFPFLPL